MGTQMYGSIDVLRFSRWTHAVSLEAIVPQDYDLYACLFGIRNFAGFSPLFSLRGRPLDPTDFFLGIEDDHDGEKAQMSWFLYAELLEMNLDGVSGLDQRISRSRDDGTEATKYAPSPSDGHIVDKLRTMTEVRENGYVYRRLVISGREAMKSFEIATRLADVLSQAFGSDGVRFCILFDE